MMTTAFKCENCGKLEENIDKAYRVEVRRMQGTAGVIGGMVGRLAR